MAVAAATTTNGWREVMVNPIEISHDKVTPELIKSIAKGGSPLDAFISEVANEMIIKALTTSGITDDGPNAPLPSGSDLNRFYNLLVEQMHPNANELAVLSSVEVRTRWMIWALNTGFRPKF